jgi:hypothetical protein
LTSLYGLEPPPKVVRKVLSEEAHNLVPLLRLQFSVSACSMGFLADPEQTSVMDFPFSARTSRRSPRCVTGLVALLLLPWGLPADTAVLTRPTQTGVCYCHCAMSRAHGGCTKMCEAKKYASRWWATTCAQPRRKPPAESHRGSPRLPHADRAEHAQLLN